MFNAFDTVVYSNRNTTVNFQSPTDQTVVNPQYNPDGSLVATRIRPADAGFGAATSAFNLRSMQAQIRFQF